jgi:hypothetical protein
MFVYVLVRGDRCKVGRSRAAPRRASAIANQAGLDDIGLHCAYPVAPALAAEIENEAHKRLGTKRIRGEWFGVSPQEAIVAIEWALMEITRRHVIAARNFPRPASYLEGRERLQRRLAAMKAGASAEEIRSIQ